MVPYILLLALPILPIIAPFSYYKKKKQQFAIVSFFLILFLLLAFRGYEVGTDISSYIYLYYAVGNAPWSSLFATSNIINEGGYSIFEKLVFSICGNHFSSFSFRIFLVVAAFVSIVPLTILYCKESNNATLTIALFVGVAPFSMFFSGLRETIAISFGAVAWLFLSRKKIVFYFFFVFLAFLFHQSAVVLLLLFPLSFVSLRKKHLPAILLLVVLLFLFRVQLFGVLTNILPRYSNYYYSIQNTGAYGFLFLLLVFLAFCFLVPNERALDSKTFLLRNILVLMVFIQVFSSISTIIMRVNYYFLILIPILVPKIIDSSMNNNKQIVATANVVMIIFFPLYFIVKGCCGTDLLEIFPYIPFWESTFHHPYSLIEELLNS